MEMERLDRDRIVFALGNLPIEVQIYESIDSTNSEAKRYALSGGGAPCAFFAESQTAGRGRMGRSFYSPDQTGVYLSLLLRAEEETADAVLMTTAAAVATWRAIRAVCGITTGIKWVNDLYYQGKKVCGILAESFFAEGNRYFIIGVGINLYTKDFPTEIQGIAGGLLDEGKDLRSRLAAEVIQNLYELTRRTGDPGLLEDYRANSMVLGRPITYVENGISFCGVAEEIDSLGRLLVRRADGERVLLASGEISLRVNEKKQDQILRGDEKES